MPSQVEIEACVNGKRGRWQIEPRLLLVDFLRRDLGLTGSHVGCDDGVCGACTVLFDGAPIKSCLMLAVQIDDADVTTVEGLGQPGRLHPVQQAFIDAQAVQCGYCTPGFVVAAAAMIERETPLTDEAVCRGLIGNLCRCGSYANIVKAVRSVASQRAAGASDIGDGCDER
ncbi:(2Fe-2S)-binding protein [Paraburkholderia sp. 40]|uniref:(2Fe-2S)-binding protein n=1 Tax=Paraburkholderia sp. 40 TaxID=2991059 RepID=UPI003D1C7820